MTTVGVKRYKEENKMKKFIIAGKTEGFDYKDAKVLGPTEIADVLITGLRAEGYRIFILLEEVSRIDDVADLRNHRKALETIQCGLLSILNNDRVSVEAESELIDLLDITDTALGTSLFTPVEEDGETD
jgi:hypothetical protein